MTEKIRVGAAACQAVVNDIEKNLETLRVWAAKAASQGARLLLFPELNLTGYSTNGEAVIPLEENHIAVKEVAGLAAQLDIALAAGMAWQDPDGRTFLAHGVWCPNGKTLIYRKTHLGTRERQNYSAGDSLPVFELSGIRVGIQLCLEQHFPEISQTLVLRGAQLILCPHATPRLSPKERRRSWNISLRARAYDNCVYVLAANQLSDNGQGTVYPGGLMLVDPAGEVMAEDFSGKPGMIVADIDLTKVVDVRTTPQGMCRRFYAPSRRPELYY